MQSMFSDTLEFNWKSVAESYLEDLQMLETKYHISKYPWDIRDIRKYVQLNENESRTFKNLWYATKAVFRGEYIALNTYIRKKKSFI